MCIHFQCYDSSKFSEWHLPRVGSFRELVENLLAPKAQKLSSQEHLQLAKMLVAKDLELKELLQQARQQEKVGGITCLSVQSSVVVPFIQHKTQWATKFVR